MRRVGCHIRKSKSTKYSNGYEDQLGGFGERITVIPLCLRDTILLGEQGDWHGLPSRHPGATHVAPFPFRGAEQIVALSFANVLVKVACLKRSVSAE